MLLGFVSGSLDEKLIERLKFFQDLACNALEIHPSYEELQNKKFSDQEIVAIKKFDYVSLHYVQKDLNFNLAFQAEDWLKILPIKLVVVHPHPELNIPALNNLNWPIALENMDRNKQTAQSVSSMREWLAKVPKAQMVLDINHCFTNDSSMQLAKGMRDNFKDKIAEIHFSGYLDAENIHEPVTTSGCEKLINFLPGKNLPIILEVYVNKLSPEILQQEFNFVRSA